MGSEMCIRDSFEIGRLLLFGKSDFTLIDALIVLLSYKAKVGEIW